MVRGGGVLVEVGYGVKEGGGGHWGWGKCILPFSLS